MDIITQRMLEDITSDEKQNNLPPVPPAYRKGCSCPRCTEYDNAVARAEEKAKKDAEIKARNCLYNNPIAKGTDAHRIIEKLCRACHSEGGHHNDFKNLDKQAKIDKAALYFAKISKGTFKQHPDLITGECAAYTMAVLYAAGFDITGSNNANHCGSILLAAGFTDLKLYPNYFYCHFPHGHAKPIRNPDPHDYSPKKGDVVTMSYYNRHSPGEQEKHKYGHICFYDGQFWHSDYNQEDSMAPWKVTDSYGYTVYYTVYRFL